MAAAERTGEGKGEQTGEDAIYYESVFFVDILR